MTNNELTIEDREKYLTNQIKVREFIDLLLDGESLEDAMNKSGVGEMKTADVLKAIVCSKYVEEVSNIFANTKEAIKTIEELDNALVELRKSSAEIKCK